VATFALGEGDDEPDEDEDDGRIGDCECAERAWMAFSTFLKNTISRKEEVKSFGAYFSNSSCVILDNDV
jgi:hypothetical protein